MNVWNILSNAHQQHGQRIAFVQDGTTYEQAFERVVELAEQLRAIGLQKGDRVACLMHNTQDHFCTYFAAAGIGAILVSLNTRLIADELREILRDSGAKALLHDTDNTRLGHAAIAETTTRSWSLDELPTIADATALPFEPDLADAGDTAHLYYTSGTTGRPKGVMLSHQNVCTHALWALEELQLAASDRWAHIAPMFHLADAWATFAITSAGGGHSFLPHFDASQALDLLAADKTTITNLVPTMLTRMVADPAAAHRDYALRVMLSGGAPIASAVVSRILQTFGCDYVQTYGMTETSPYLTVSLLDDALRQLPASEQLRMKCRTGRPFGSIDLRVVDDAGNSIEANDTAVGEVRVAGATVTRGYWQNDDATRAAFDDDGFLCTGDLATIDQYGSINIVDRKKDVIKTGGESVYSTEVEQVLFRHPAVLECAVYGTPDDEWGEVVAAAVVLQGGMTADADELIGYCREHMARFKAPRRIRLLDDLPKTGSGKIQKNQLRDLR